MPAVFAAPPWTSAAVSATLRVCFCHLDVIGWNVALKVDNNTSPEEVASLCVGCLSPPKPLAERYLRGTDFSAPGRWITQKVTFEVREDMEGIQFGIVGTGKTPITVDYLDLIAEPEARR